MTHLVEARAVALTHPGRRSAPDAVRALDGVDLIIDRGDRIALVGESGGGKTSLARLLLGLIPPDHGQIYWSGIDLATLTRRERDQRRPGHVQLIWQDPYATLDPRATVRDTLTESLDRHARHEPSAHRAARLAELLHLIDLEAAIDRRVEVLSGGERRRLALARALAARPAVLIADEVTTGLDPVLKRDIVDVLARVTTPPDGPALVLITHDLDAAHALCDTIHVIRRGRIVQRLDRPVAEPGDDFTRDLTAAHHDTRLPEALRQTLHGSSAQRGVATLEYIVVLGAATLFLGAVLHLIGEAMADYLEFALWWLANPLH